MVPFSDHFASFDQNGTHHGIGRSLSPSCLSKMESSFHPLFIVHKPSFKQNRLLKCQMPKLKCQIKSKAEMPKTVWISDFDIHLTFGF
jgi:hypothetical protein